MMRLLMTARGEGWTEPFTVDELLSTGRAVLEPLFHEPPLGPVPDYLLAHGSVYGCVAEYEEKLEDLDRWKVQQLTRWLTDRIGTHWKDAGRVVELQMEAGAEAAFNRFRFRRVEDPGECGKVMSEGSFRQSHSAGIR